MAAGQAFKFGDIARGKGAFLRKAGVQLRQLSHPQRCVQVGHAVVIADFIMRIGPAMRDLGGRRQMFGVAAKFDIVRQDRTAAARGDDLVAIEAERRNRRQRSAGPPLVLAAKRFSGVFHHHQPKFGGDCIQTIHVNRMAKDMHRHHTGNPPPGVFVEQPLGPRHRDLAQMGGQCHRV